MNRGSSGRTNALQGAKLVITKCLHLSRNESFLLIYDETTRHFRRLFEQAADESGVHFESHYVSRRLQASDKAFDAPLARSLGRAHGILAATTDDPSCSKFRIALTTEKRGAGSAVATMPGASLEILAEAIDVDYDEVERMCRNLTLPLLKGKRCVILTYDRRGNEYKLTFDLDSPKRIPIQSLGIISAEAWGNIPAGETFVSPLETSAEGDYLVNGAVGSEKVGRNEALLTFRKGKLVNHRYLRTGKPVEYLLGVAAVALDNGHDACWATIAELGIGVNKKIRRLVGVQLVDEKKYGTLHLAVGHNRGYGGANDCASVHCDITTERPTLLVDGHVVIDRGEHTQDFSPFLEDYRTSSVPRTWRWRPEYDHVHVNDGSFLIESGLLNVVRRTASGRKTVFQLGDPETAVTAARLVDIIGKGNPRVEHLRGRLDLPAADLDRLLSLLHVHGVVEHG